MFGSWVRVKDLDHAAAFRALGIKVQSDKGERVRGGKPWAMWTACIDANNLFPNGAAGALVRAVQHDALAGIDPAHPVLDFLGVLKIRHQVVDAVKNGRHYRIDVPQSGYGAVLVPGDEPSVPSQSVFKTGDIKLAACLIRLGLPLLRIEGTSPDCLLVLAVTGYSLGGDPPHHATLARVFRALPKNSWAFPAPAVDASLDPVLNRLRSLMHVLWVRDRLHDYINGRVQNLIVESPFNGRMVLMPEDSTGRTIDKVRKFLHIP